MQQIMYIFPLVIGSVILIGATTALVKHFTKKSENKWKSIATVLVAVLLGFFMFKAIYRPFGLYQNHFKQATGLTLGSQGEYVFADLWIDNQANDHHSSIALIEFSEAGMIELKGQLKALKYSTIADSIKIQNGLKDRLNYALNYSDSRSIVEEYGLVEKRQEKRNGTMFKVDKILYYFGFLEDDKTVVAYIVSK
jgi:hypothetical protein